MTSELDRTAESASGHVYGDLSGKVRFRRKDWMVWTTGAAPDATIGNIAAGDVCPSGWTVRFARDDLTTRVIVGRDGEEPTVMDNPEGFGLYGAETWERTDLLPVDDFELTRIGSRILAARHPDTMPRIASVTLHASTGSGEVADLLASASPYTPSRFRCRHQATGRTALTGRCSSSASPTPSPHLRGGPPSWRWMTPARTRTWPTRPAGPTPTPDGRLTTNGP